MRSLAAMSAFAAFALVFASPSPTIKEEPRQASLPTVTASGNAFFAGNERFYVRGVAYQPGGSAANIDPLADPKVCLADVKNFQSLGINTIRVYSTDNSKNHDQCMNALADAGIYVALDANNPQYSINQKNPQPSYNDVYLQSIFATIDAFAKYPNTLAFYSGNEVIHNGIETTHAAPYVKATTRDMRQYIRSRGYRNIPVGYSAADVTENRMQTAHYFNCGSDDERSDFFAFNDYSWCNSNFQMAGWDQKVKNFTGYGIPIFLSEYGCITNGRSFGEIEALMSNQMTGVYSGGLMYEYSMETNNYGIVQIETDGKDFTGAREQLPEFKTFADAMSKYKAPSGDGGFVSTSASVPCPTKDSFWDVDSTLLPSIPEPAKKYMAEGAGTGPGLKGPGSQTAGTPSTGDVDSGSGTASSAPGASTSVNAGVSRMEPVDKTMLVISGIMLCFTLMGAFAL